MVLFPTHFLTAFPDQCTDPMPGSIWAPQRRILKRSLPVGWCAGLKLCLLLGSKVPGMWTGLRHMLLYIQVPCPFKVPHTWSTSTPGQCANPSPLLTLPRTKHVGQSPGMSRLPRSEPPHCHTPPQVLSSRSPTSLTSTKAHGSALPQSALLFYCFFL